MNLRNLDQLDPNLLPGLLNTALRNDCGSLEDLLRTHDLDEEKLSEKMKNLGFRYEPEVNQFRPLRSEESD
ncbi:MAG: DUF4250 domain-containing protein [Verrucomicrobiota bacterium]